MGEPARYRIEHRRFGRSPVVVGFAETLPRATLVLVDRVEAHDVVVREIASHTGG
jgi:hypothetical protein